MSSESQFLDLNFELTHFSRILTIQAKISWRLSHFDSLTPWKENMQAKSGPRRMPEQYASNRAQEPSVDIELGHTSVIVSEH